MSYSDIFATADGQPNIDVQEKATLNWGNGNIAADPLFVNTPGPDGTIGTLDDDLHLSANSPCIDAGDDAALPADMSQDREGEPRTVGRRVDVGGYEFREERPSPTSQPPSGG